MDGVIGAVATVDLVAERYGSVGGDIDPEDELFEIGPMVLVDAMGDPRLLERSLVASVEGDGGGVVVDAAAVELELLDEVQRETEKEASRLRGRQGVEGASDAVVVDRILLLGREAQGGGGDRPGPVRDTVERARGEEDVVEENRQRLGVIRPVHAGSCQAGAQDGGEPHAVEEMAQDEVGPEEVDPQLGGSLGGGHAGGASELSCIHSEHIVY